MLVHRDLMPLPFNPKDYHFKQSWFQLLRPMTLTGTITPILVGTGFAASYGTIRIDLAVALLIASILIQATTNLLNDYFDLKHGQDKDKWIMVNEEHVEHRPAYQSIPWMASAMLTVAIGIGLWLAIESSWIIIPIGVISILAGITYSAGTHSFASLSMGEVIALIYLGIVVTTLGFVVQGNPLNFEIMFIALPFALLIAAMILTNNIRDIDKDLPFRKTLAIVFGKNFALFLLLLIVILVYITVGLLITYAVLPSTTLLTLLTLLAIPVAVKLLYSFHKSATRVDELKAMKWAAIHHWVFGLLYVVGIWM